MNWDERAKAVLAQGCTTFSKRSDQYIEGVYPTHYEDFHGVDMVCGLGSNLIGFKNNFSLPSQKEVILAERVKALFPCIDKLKILKTGSAACSAAARFARAYTGMRTVLGTGYHGTDNVFIAAEKPGAGCADEGYQKLDSLEVVIRILGIIDRCAAVIVEPVQLDLSVEPALREIRRLCTEKNIPLIFDEIISGFRVPKYGFCNYFGIQPDLICLGKALGNGAPIAIMGGRADIMDTEGVFISNTHNGELHGLEAALETLDFLTEEKLQELWDRGKWFQEEFNAINPKIQIKGYPTRGELQGEELYKAIFMQEMCKAGYLFGRAWFINFHHDRVLRSCLDRCRSISESIEAGKVKLEGKPPRPIFRRN